MQGIRGLLAGGAYGALVAASSMFFGGLVHAGQLIAAGEAHEAPNALAAATFLGGIFAGIVGAVVGAIIGFILGSAGGAKLASPVGCIIVAFIAVLFMRLSFDEEPIVALLAVPVVGLATGRVAWWAGRQFAAVVAAPTSPPTVEAQPVARMGKPEQADPAPIS